MSDRDKIEKAVKKAQRKRLNTLIAQGIKKGTSKSRKLLVCRA
jgi:hypothetical protein